MLKLLFNIVPSETLLKEITIENGKLLLDNENLRQSVKINRTEPTSDSTYTIFSMDGGRCKMKDVNWKEVKMGALYEYDEDEKPKNKHYFGRVDIESKHFGELAHYHYINYCKNRTKTVFLSDGMPYNWEIKNQHFPHAIEVLDFYHASEHLSHACKIIFGEETPAFNEKYPLYKGFLYEGEKEKIFAWFEKEKEKLSNTQKTDFEKEEQYFIKNKGRINYKEYRVKGVPIGSGVMESAIKQTVNQRLKSSEKTWSQIGANTMLQLKLQVENGTWDDFIKKKVA